MKIEDEFICPECGSTYWGTVFDPDLKNGRGHCHDQFNRGCKFTWKRADDDDVFRVVVTMTRSEYQRNPSIGFGRSG